MKIKKISVELPKELNEKLEKLIKNGKYVTKSEIIRRALEEFLRKEGKS